MYTSQCSSMGELLQRMCQIISKTGEKVIFSDLNTRNEYVILKLQDYEIMIERMTIPKVTHGQEQNAILAQQSLTASSPLDKMNCEIALLKKRTVEHQAVDTKQTLHAETQKREIKDERRDGKGEAQQYYFEPLE